MEIFGDKLKKSKSPIPKNPRFLTPVTRYPTVLLRFVDAAVG